MMSIYNWYLNGTQITILTNKRKLDFRMAWKRVGLWVCEIESLEYGVKYWLNNDLVYIFDMSRSPEELSQ